MTGPEHYREAERLLADARDRSGPVMGYQDESLQIAEAQAHATLALVAAVAADRLTTASDVEETTSYPLPLGELSWDEALG